MSTPNTEIDVAEAIEDLEAEASNEQIEKLLAVIRELHWRDQEKSEEIERLQRQVRMLTRGTNDPDDKAILQWLAEETPEKVTMHQFKQQYRRHTRLKQDDTIKRRVKALTDMECFEYEQPGEWRFVPEEFEA